MTEWKVATATAIECNLRSTTIELLHERPKKQIEYRRRYGHLTQKRMEGKMMIRKLSGPVEGRGASACGLASVVTAGPALANQPSPSMKWCFTLFLLLLHLHRRLPYFSCFFSYVCIVALLCWSNECVCMHVSVAFSLPRYSRVPFCFALAIPATKSVLSTLR